ncbi:hypothetical protein HYX14_01185 [Candidatus Woesearchaeota archaeon]|nr:hypothetical protein [Candidatus Woesearchaeota archaeon]
MTRDLRQLIFDNGHLCDATSKASVRGEAVPCNPMTIKVNMGEVSNVDLFYERKYRERIHQAVLEQLPAGLVTTGQFTAYAYGLSYGVSPDAEGCYYVPIQFYKVK